MAAKKRKRNGWVILAGLGSLALIVLNVFPSWFSVLKGWFIPTVRVTVGVTVAERGISAFPNPQSSAPVPLGLWVFITVTNETSAALTVEGYRLEVQRPDDSWGEMPRIIFNSGGCVGTGDRRFDLPDGIFDEQAENALRSGGIAPGQRIQGWMFFSRPDWFKSLDQARRLGNLRLYGTRDEGSS